MTARAMILAVFAIMAIGVVAINYYVAVPLRARIVDREMVHVDAMTRNMLQLTEGRLQIVELLLQNAATALGEPGITPRQAHEVLKTSVDAVPVIRVIGVFDPQGNIVRSSRSVVPPAVNLADRDYVSHWLNGGSGDRFLSGPALNAVDGRWQISLSKAMRDGDRLIGVISAVINVDLLGVATHASPDETDNLTLLDRRFTLIDRFPARPQDVGRSLADAEIYRALAASPSGKASGIFGNVFTGEQRIGVAYRFYDDGLVLSSSRPVGSVLRYWKQLVLVSAGVSGLLLVMMAAVVLAIVRDTRLRRAHTLHLEGLNLELKSRSEEAERLARVKSDFLATMSHEIRTPLTAIMGMLELCRHTTDTATIERHLRVADGASRMLLGIINDILDSERLETGRMTLEETAFDLVAVATQVVDTVRPQADAKGLALALTLPRELPACFIGDPMRLSQILFNLLGNAVKFTATGAVELSFGTLHETAGRHRLRFEIADTGPGIPADKIPLLFQPFEQLTSWRARSSGGSGLGLSICKRLVDAMRGQIGVATEEGCGSRFWFEIELSSCPADAIPAQAGTLAAADRPAEILVVDDNAINRDLIEQMLSAHGHRVIVESGGRAAIDRLRERRFDVVLLDIQMPEMDGIETIREMRASNLIEDTAVLALTANTMSDQVEEYRAAGFDACVAKPIVWPTLFATIANARKTSPENVPATSPVDWAAIENVAAILGDEKTLEMLEDAIRLARVMADRITDDLSEAAMVEMTHTMHGFLGNLGIAGVSGILAAAGDRSFRERPALRRSMIDALDRASAQIAAHFEARRRSRTVAKAQ